MSKITPSTPAAHEFDQSIAKKNKRIAIAMMVVFIAPVAIAYILLKTGIYQSFGTSNRGLLLDPPISVTAEPWIELDLESKGDAVTAETLSKSWWLAFEMPRVCDVTCEQRLLQIRQSLQALGPDQQRVRPLIITHANSDLKTLKMWEEQVALIGTKVLQIQHLALANPVEGTQENLLHNKGSDVDTGGLYIVDPMGFVMLYYAPAKTADDAIPQAKSLIKDLKYLLKVSRIG